ncbi:MAG: DUF3616 domain-containing protein [Desulfobulbaceae bacterium]|nr:DUF3616 domain-containing protein [Desulfobulbaceae bacterium]
MIRQNRGVLLYYGMIALLVINLLPVKYCEAAMKKIQAFKFADIYEPSTVVQLADGAVLIAEDEGDEPLFHSPVTGHGKDLKLEPVQLKGINGAFDDLEGSALGKNDEVFLITSHSTNKKGKRKKKRELLTRLVLKDGKISEKTHHSDLLLPMKEALESEPGGDTATSKELDIEGLSFDSAKNRLLIGLRSPLVGGKAIILILENPYALLSNGQPPKFQQKKIYLDIGGGGIRSITYDADRKVYLIANEIPNNKGKKKGKLRPALWAWDGKSHSSPTRVELPKLKGIKNIEGIALVKSQKTTFLLMVCDDGDPQKKKGAHYTFLDTSNLEY